MYVRANLQTLTIKLVWKKVEEYLRLFETYGGNWFSPFLLSLLRKLVLFSRVHATL